MYVELDPCWEQLLADSRRAGGMIETASVPAVFLRLSKEFMPESRYAEAQSARDYLAWQEHGIAPLYLAYR